MKEHLWTKKGEKYALNRSDWTIYENFVQMYDVIYEEMVDAGVAEFLEEEVWTDRDGNVVEEKLAYGLSQNIKITHPHYIIFGDETGFNTSQKKDGHVGGRRYVCGRDTVPQKKAATNDHKFTALPFTSASGEGVCCVIIFQCKTEQVPFEWQAGIDHTKGIVYNSDGSINAEESIGPGKYFPGGPKCNYNGKEIDCLVFGSESGGITDTILVKILSYFDEKDVFPRKEGGPIPMLIVDGHQSRLAPSFITYINDKGHRWKVCFGVPYATDLWQVGDASELNGRVKLEWTKAKEELLEMKEDKQLPLRIGLEDVMPLFNKIFPLAFCNVENNKKATSFRGWNPPNRQLLQHPVLKPIETPQQDTSSYDSIPTLPEVNTDDGLSATVLDKLLRHRERSAAAAKATNKRKSDTGSVHENYKKGKKFTSGFFVSHGIHSLDHPDLINLLTQREKEKTDAIAKQENDRKTKAKKLRDAVFEMRRKYNHESTHLFQPCTAAECTAYLQYKKSGKEDGAMPKTLVEKKQRCMEWISRPSPPNSPVQAAGDGLNVTADVLMGEQLFKDGDDLDGEEMTNIELKVTQRAFDK